MLLRAAQTRVHCRKQGVTEQTSNRGRGKVDGLNVSDAKCLRAREVENRRLQMQVADVSLE